VRDDAPGEPHTPMGTYHTRPAPARQVKKDRFHTRSLCGIGFSPETLVSKSRPKYLGFQVYRFTKVNT